MPFMYREHDYLDLSYNITILVLVLKILLFMQNYVCYTFLNLIYLVFLKLKKVKLCQQKKKKILIDVNI